MTILLFLTFFLMVSATWINKIICVALLVQCCVGFPHHWSVCSGRARPCSTGLVIEESRSEHQHSATEPGRPNLINRWNTVLTGLAECHFAMATFAHYHFNIFYDSPQVLPISGDKWFQRKLVLGNSWLNVTFYRKNKSNLWKSELVYLILPFKKKLYCRLPDFCTWAPRNYCGEIFTRKAWYYLPRHEEGNNKNLLFMLQFTKQSGLISVFHDINHHRDK